MSNNLTRIKNNQITDSTIQANAKVVPYSITSTLLANNLTYGSDLTVTGNLTVQGNSTQIDSTITTIEDPVILLASTQSGTPTADIGFIGDRGSSSNIALVWREANSEFVTAFTTTGETNSTITLSSYADFHTNNATVDGNLTVSGNITGNISVAGTLTAGNLATPGTVSAAGNVTGNYFIGDGSQLTNVAATTATQIINGTSNLNIATANANIVAGVNGTANVLTITENGLNVDGGTGYISAAGNISGANINASGDVTGANIYTGGTVSATGALYGANAIISDTLGANTINAGFVSATGTVTADSGIFTNGNISVAGNVRANNVHVNDFVTANTFHANIEVSSAGNVIGGNVLTGGEVSATGNITGGNISTTGAGGDISGSGNITGGNILTGGQVSATGNVTGNYFIGNGSQLTGIDTTRIVNGTSNVAITTPNGNILTTVNGTANVMVVSDIGANITGYANVTGNLDLGGSASVAGNVNSGNLLTTGQVSATGNVYTAALITSNIEGQTQLTISTVSGDIVINPASGNIDASTAWINNLSDPVNAQDAATKNYVDTTAQGLHIHQPANAATTTTLATITGGFVTYNNGNAGVGATLTTTGTYTNVDGVAINTANSRILVKSEANAAWNGVYTYSNSTVLVRALDMDQDSNLVGGDFLFVTSGDTYADTQWVQTTDNVVVGTSNIVFTQFGGAGTYTAGNGVSINGTVINTIYDGNITVNGSNQLSIANGAVLLNPNVTDATGTSFSASGNVTGGNINTGGLITATGNITGGNISTAGLIGGGNIETGGYVSATGNVTGGNVNTGGTVSATGDITGANNISGNTITSTTTISAGGNILTGSAISASGDVSGNNLYASGEVSAVGNITANPSSFFIGNGSQLTGVAASSVNAAALVGNTLSSNVIYSSLESVGILANLSVSGNVVAGNISTTGDVTGANVISATTFNGTTVSVTGDVTGANLLTGGSVSATGNVTGGNITTGGNVSATGNVYAANFIGNISGNIDAAGNITEVQFNTTGDILGASANFTYDAANNVMTVNSGTINSATLSATGSVHGGNITITGDTVNGSNGIIQVNGAQADTNFAAYGYDNSTPVFFVDAGTYTASFGSDAQVTDAIVAFNATNSVVMPAGNTAQRPASGVTGMLRFNSTLNYLEVFDNSQWSQVGQDTFTVITDEQFNGDGSTVAFTLGSTQSTSSVIVSINGVVQTPTTAYSVSGTYPTCVLTFTEAPQSGDVIDVRELTTTVAVGSISSGNSSVTATGSTIDIQGNLNPTANLTYTLGNSTNMWSSLYVGGNTIYLGNLQLKESSANTFAVYTADGTTEANIAVGNIDVTSIQSGTSSISIAAPNGNAVLNVAGTNRVIATSTGAVVTGALSATGNITGTYLFGNGSQLTGIDATSIQNGTANVRTFNNGNVTTSAAGTANVVVVTSAGQITTGLISATGNITGSYIIGNGSQLTGLPAGYANSDVATYLASGTVSTDIKTTALISATGNVTGGNVTTAGLISATGNITGGNITTAGALSATGAGYIGGGLSVVGNITATGNINYTNVTDLVVGDPLIYIGANNTSNLVDLGLVGSANVSNVYQHLGLARNHSTGVWGLFGNVVAEPTTVIDWANAVYQPFQSGTITSTGNVSATGNVIGGNVTTAGLISATGNVTGGNVLTGGIVSATGNVTGANFITSGAISASGNISTTGNIINSGNILFNTLLSVGSGTISTSGNVTAGGSLFVGNTGAPGGGQIVGNVVTANTATLGSLYFYNDIITATGSYANTGVIINGNLQVIGNIVNGNGNGVGNIGSSTTYFNTVFAKATSAQYADLAEKYTADAEYAPGTVLAFGGDAEVTVSSTDGDRRVAGVVSTNPSYIMNGTLEGANVATVALTGRVPTKVTGTVRKGDLMVSNGDGTARAEADPKAGSIIGKALADFDGTTGTIEVVVGRF